MNIQQSIIMTTQDLMFLNAQQCSKNFRFWKWWYWKLDVNRWLIHSFLCENPKLIGPTKIDFFKKWINVEWTISKCIDWLTQSTHSSFTRARKLFEWNPHQSWLSLPTETHDLSAIVVSAFAENYHHYFVVRNRYHRTSEGWFDCFYLVVP